jgi:hypothetical protein
MGIRRGPNAGVLIKSPEMLAMEQRAREQSAMELMAQGAISFEMSPRQQAAYDDAVRFAAEVDERERAHYDQLPVQIAAENQRVMADLNAGRLYLANATGGGGQMIHFASCAAVRHQVDRDVAHAFDLEETGELEGSWHSGLGYHYVAKWPELMTLDEVEQLRAYRACQRCNPDTKERRKLAAANPKPSKLMALTVDRIGREYETVSGEYLGKLQSYTVSEDLIVMRCSVAEHRGAHESLVVLRPR